jgi:hypothetical protein
MTSCERRVVGSGILLLAAAWAIFDSATVGNRWGTNDPPWAMNSIRIPLLALSTVVCGLVALAFGRGQAIAPKVTGRVTVTGAAMVMWICCTYTMWRCYQISTHMPGTMWFIFGVLLEIGVVFITARLWRHRT